MNAATMAQTWKVSTTESGATTWGCPEALYRALDQEFRFDIDVAAAVDNTKHVRFFTKDTDALAQSWTNLAVFCNPPYGRQIERWVRKAVIETGDMGCPLAVLLLPARTGNQWFHKWVVRHAEIRFIRGRLGFVLPGGVSTKKHHAPFDSMVCVYRADRRGAGTLGDQLVHPFLRRVV